MPLKNPVIFTILVLVVLLGAGCPAKLWVWWRSQDLWLLYVVWYIHGLGLNRGWLGNRRHLEQVWPAIEFRFGLQHYV
jgi:hypothetical protein